MNYFELRLCGSGGQGLQLGAKILSAALIAENKRVAQSQAYEPTSRGGLSRSDLVVSDDDVDFPLVTELDFLVVLDQVAVHPSLELLKPSTLILADSELVTDPPEGDYTIFSLPLTGTARDLGSARSANVVALGAITVLGNLCKTESAHEALETKTPAKFREINLRALTKGFDLAQNALASQKVLRDVSAG